MKLGINWTPPHACPADWARQLSDLGCRAAVFPVDYTAPVGTIDAYVRSAAEYDISIAEVGVWNSLVIRDDAAAARNYAFARGQLEMADYVKACCCVNVSGATGPKWYMGYSENYTNDTFTRNVDILCKLLDEVRPQHTCYTLEIMQWMLPDSPEQYLEILEAVNRNHFAVHLDVVNLVHDPRTYFHHNEVIDTAFSLLGDRVKSCHLKDLKLRDGVTVSFQEVPPGEGDINLLHYGKKINEQDENLPLLIEHLDSKEAYARALAYVKALYCATDVAM